MRRFDPANASDNRQCVLFLSSDSYCCGRYCEEFFNHLAAESNLEWRAAARALRSTDGIVWRYPMSPIAVDFLRRRQVRAARRSEPPAAVTSVDLRTSSLAVALDEQDNKRVVDSAWPQYAGSVRYWRGGVLREGFPNDVFERLLQHVRNLVHELGSERESFAA